jgi:RNAse (barnase) inhibitor barstar
MVVDWIMALIRAFVFFIYGSICAISILFTFSIDKYRKVDELLDLSILSSRILTPLDINLVTFDAWLVKYHRVVGPILALLSIIDTKLSFDIINAL